MAEIHSRFANLPTDEFVEYLGSHGLEPTYDEKHSKPFSGTTLRSGIETSILEVTGQRFGEPGVPGESSAK